VSRVSRCTEELRTKQAALKTRLSGKDSDRYLRALQQLCTEQLDKRAAIIFAAIEEITREASDVNETAMATLKIEFKARFDEEAAQLSALIEKAGSQNRSVPAPTLNDPKARLVAQYRAKLDLLAEKFSPRNNAG